MEKNNFYNYWSWKYDMWSMDNLHVFNKHLFLCYFFLICKRELNEILPWALWNKGGNDKEC